VTCSSGALAGGEADGSGGSASISSVRLRRFIVSATALIRTRRL
jgi:hypothetical protein